MPADTRGARPIAIRENHLSLHGIAAGPLASRFGAGGEGPSIHPQDPRAARSNSQDGRRHEG